MNIGACPEAVGVGVGMLDWTWWWSGRGARVREGASGGKEAGVLECELEREGEF